MTYRAPVADYAFILDHIVEYARVAQTARFAEADRDVVAAIIEEAAKLSNDVIAPLDRGGDLSPARLENGGVVSSPGFADAFGQIAEGGWIGMLAEPDNGGMGLPLTLASVVNEMMSGACLSLALEPLMCQGQIEALEHHASDEIKALYLPKLVSGEWCGTMNLTESGAGSDVGALRTKATRNDDGSYDITGQKIFITWGDNDFSGNICHLVLARLPDGAEGTKGISLFLVPKFIPDENGEAGAANSLSVVSLEHKLGIHGSPTCVMDYSGAKGWLVGNEHEGMKCMFTMMNNARLGVGMQASAWPRPLRKRHTPMRWTAFRAARHLVRMARVRLSTMRRAPDARVMRAEPMWRGAFRWRVVWRLIWGAMIPNGRRAGRS